MKQRVFRELVGGVRLSMSAALVAGLTMGVVSACSGDDDPPRDPADAPLPTGAVSVEVTYPDATAASVTAVLRAWVLAEREGASVSEERGKFNCASLIGGSLDPYDLTLVRLADVASVEDVTKVTAEHVPPGDYLVYAEASGFGGEAEFAGCAATSVLAAEVSAAMALSRAKIFDCSDPDTEDDSPCDDGRLCTVGEVCDNSTCGDGVARDCGFAADGCNAGSCDETNGCVIQPLADGTPCDDDQFCTGTDTCSEGECVGAPRNCATDVAACQVPVRCDEELDLCVTTDAPFGTTCDDGLFCTEVDTCDSFGTCQGTTRDCETGVPQCQVSAGCDESTDTCLTANALLGSFCDDTLFCTVSDQCDGLGACTGTPRICTGLAGECEVDVCDDVFDVCDVADALLGTTCEDGLFCTELDECDGFGFCVGGSEPDCSGLDDQCNVGVCDENSSSCQPDPVGSGLVCDDDNAGTTDDECDGAGACVGTPI